MSRNYTKKKNPSKRDGTKSYKDKGSRKEAPDRNFAKKGEDSKRIKDAINDVSWYAKNPQLLKDAASIPFSQMLGLPIPYAGGKEVRIPGLCILRVAPAFGGSSEVNTGNDALNVAAQSLYTYVRHANSGHSNYDPNDLMVYILAMDQAYSFHAELVRLYGLMKFYSGYNRYTGKYLVNALGWDYDELITNMPTLRYLINDMAVKLACFAVPAIFPMYERHRWIYSNIYMDRPSVKAQMYCFVPHFYGVYNEPVTVEEEEYKAGLKAKYAYTWDRGISYIRERISEMLDPLMASEDIGIMSGDILKAYGVEKCYNINAISEDYVTMPVYVAEVLKQIHNLTTIGEPELQTQNEDAMLVWQNGTDPYIHTWNRSNAKIPIYSGTESEPSQLFASVMSEYLRYGHIIDTDVPSPSPEDVMVMTRLTHVPVKTEVAGPTIALEGIGMWASGNPISCYFAGWIENYKTLGADAITYITVFDGQWYNVDSTTKMPPNWDLYTYSCIPVQQPTSSQSQNVMHYRKAVAALSKFEWHPITFELSINNTSNFAINELIMSGDIDNCTLIKSDTLVKMHDVAIMSMLDIPTATLSSGV